MVLANAMKERAVRPLGGVRSRQGGRNSLGNVCCGLENGGDYLWLNELYVSGKRGYTVSSKIARSPRRTGQKPWLHYLALVTIQRRQGATSLREQGFETGEPCLVDSIYDR
jgi:hypothetical protein